ncbi:MAG TPA: hypothetical protein VFP65_23545 [Anaeromyxobacteraceae bacterium]|nr:hypothetical protein [Anaeromyxobacteraceae bacterium]
MDGAHQHPPEAKCLPGCPCWANGALHFFAVQHRYAEMLEACRTAEAVESMIVAPSKQGVKLPEYLETEELVRLNLVVGRDCPELLMDEWGLRCTLTFRGRRFDCAIPWPAVSAGELRPPAQRRPRFQVIAGGKSDEDEEGTVA